MCTDTNSTEMEDSGIIMTEQYEVHPIHGCLPPPVSEQRELDELNLSLGTYVRGTAWPGTLSIRLQMSKQ